MRHPRVRRAPVGQIDPEAVDPEGSILGRPAPGEAEVECVIRLPAHPFLGPCSICAVDFEASGPTGFVDGEVVCDACLLAMEPRLGMVLALVALVRSYGRVEPGGQLELDLVRAELLAFARVYERWASKYGPARPPLGTIYDLADHAALGRSGEGPPQ